MKPHPSEFELIDAFLAPFHLAREGAPGARESGVLAGPGDDCAVLAPRAGQRLVATTDALVEGVHFDLAYGSAQDAGHKALAVNLSDLAAAGARPRWFLCALSAPRTRDSALLDLARGLGEGAARLARRSDLALVGGNLVAAGSGWSLTITALGEARAPLSRRGAQPGDLLVVAGELGAAALGLRLLRARTRPALRLLRLPRESAAAAVQAQLRPEPLVSAGLVAAAHATAAVDVSDGLLADLRHLLDASRCGAELDCALLPRSSAVRAAEAQLARAGAHPYSLSLAGGEDYALVLAVRPAQRRALLTSLREARVPACVIGRCVEGRGLSLRDGARALAPPERSGFDHLA